MQVEGYFSKIKHFRADISKSMEELNLSTINRIERGELNIGEHSISIQKKDMTNPEKDYGKKLLQLKDNRQNIQIKLSKINEEQGKIRALSLKNNQKKISQKNLQSSHFTKQEKINIKKAKHKKQQFEANLKKKMQQLNQQIQTQQKNIENEQKFQMQVKKNQRKILLKQKRMKTEQMKNEKRTLESQLGFSAKKKNSYLYKLNEKHDKQLEKQRQRYQTLILNEKKTKMKTDFDQIKHHSIQHETLLNQRREQFVKKFQESNVTLKKQLFGLQSIFAKRIKQAERRKKLEEQRNKHHKKQMLQKVSQFQEYVTQNFQPKQNQKSHFTPYKKTEPLHNLSPQQRATAGNAYMRQVKKVLKKVEDKSHRDIEVTTTDPFTKTPRTPRDKKYPNYLVDLRKSRQQSQINFIQKLTLGQLTPEKAQTASTMIFQKQLRTKNKRNKTSEYELAKQKIVLLNSIIDAIN